MTESSIALINSIQIESDAKGRVIPTVQFCVHSTSRDFLCEQFVLFCPRRSSETHVIVYYLKVEDWADRESDDSQ